MLQVFSKFFAFLTLFFFTSGQIFAAAPVQELTPAMMPEKPVPAAASTPSAGIQNTVPASSLGFLQSALPVRKQGMITTRPLKPPPPVPPPPDKTAPTGNILIENGKPVVMNPKVRLKLTAQDNSGTVTEIRFVTGFSPGSWGNAVSFQQEIDYDLPVKNGLYVVWVQFKDAAGNWSAPVVSNVICLTGQPVEVLLTSSPYTANKNYELTFTVDGKPQPPQKMVFEKEEARPITVQGKDGLGAPVSKTFTVVYDPTPPLGSVQIKSGTPLKGTRDVVLALEAYDHTGIRNVRFSTDGKHFSDPVTLSFQKSSKPENKNGIAYSAYHLFTFPSDGPQRVYAQYEDLAGNISQTAVTEEIVVDATPPSGRVVLGNGEDTTNAQTIPMNFLADDGPGRVTQVLISFNGVDFQRYPYPQTQSYNFSDKATRLTVYAKFIDAFGNESPLVSDSIGYDPHLKTPEDPPLSAPQIDFLVASIAGGLTDQSRILVKNPDGSEMEMEGRKVKDWYVHDYLGKPRRDGGNTGSVSNPPKTDAGVDLSKGDSIYVVDIRDADPDRYLHAEVIRNAGIAARIIGTSTKVPPVAGKTFPPLQFPGYITEAELLRDLRGSVDAVSFQNGKIALKDLIIDLAGGAESRHPNSLNIDLRDLSPGSEPMKLSGLTAGKSAIKTSHERGIIEVLEYLHQRGAVAKQIHLEHFPNRAYVSVGPDMMKSAAKLMGPDSVFTVMTGSHAVNFDKPSAIKDLLDPQSELAQAYKKMGLEVKAGQPVNLPRYGMNYFLEIKKTRIAQISESAGSSLVRGVGKGLLAAGIVLDTVYLVNAFKEDLAEGKSTQFEESFGAVAGGWLGGFVGFAVAAGLIAGGALAAVPSGGASVVAAVALSAGLTASGAVIGAEIGKNVTRLVTEKTGTDLDSAVANAVSHVKNATVEAVNNVVNAVAPVVNQVASGVSNAVNAVTDTAANAVNTVADTAAAKAADVAKDIGNVAGNIRNQIVDAGKAVVDKSLEIWQQTQQKIADFIQGLEQGYAAVLAKAKDFWEKLKDRYDDFKDDVNDFWSDSRKGEKRASNLVEYWSKRYDKYEKLAKNMKRDVKNADDQLIQIDNEMDGFWAQASNTLQNLENEIQGVSGQLGQRWPDFERLWKETRAQYDSIGKKIGREWKKSQEGIEDYRKQLVAYVKDIANVGLEKLDAIISAVARTGKKAVDAIKEVAEKTVDLAKGAWDTAKNVFEGVKNFVTDLVSTAWNGVKNAVKSMWDFFTGKKP